MEVLDRRRLLSLVAGTTMFPMLARRSWAENYPSRPVRILVGFVAGGSTDIVARIIGHWLSEKLNQPFIVDNRPGAAANIAAEVVANAAPDGYTLLLVFSSYASNAALHVNSNVKFNLDIVPVASVARGALFLATTPSLPQKTLPALVAYAKANPGKLNLGSTGVGTPSHLAGELFKTMTGITMQHVPYRGDGPLIADLVAGHMDAGMVSVGASLELVKAGKLRALGVTTSSRMEVARDIPAIAEFVPGFDASTWFGVGAPPNTPPEIVDTLNKYVTMSLSDPTVIRGLTQLGISPFPGSPAEFGKLITSDIAKWTKVVRAADIKMP
jgi:tripartite-type tricarboxylate transporter receptor subunit TctC